MNGIVASIPFITTSCGSNKTNDLSLSYSGWTTLAISTLEPNNVYDGAFSLLFKKGEKHDYQYEILDSKGNLANNPIIGVLTLDGQDKVIANYVGQKPGEYSYKIEAFYTENGTKHTSNLIDFTCYLCEWDEEYIPLSYFNFTSSEMGPKLVGPSSSMSLDELQNYNTFCVPYFITRISGKAFNGVNFSSETNLIFQDGNLLKEVGQFAFFNATIKTADFSNCLNLESIEEKAFLSCPNLTQVVFPQNDKFTVISSSCFWNCTSLTSVTFPDQITTIGDQAFLNCKSLTQINLSKNLSTISNLAFSICTSLEEINWAENSNTNLSTGFASFASDNSLTSITFPSNLTVIGEESFSGCTNLESITLHGNIKEIDEAAFRSDTKLSNVLWSDLCSLDDITIGDYAFMSISSSGLVNTIGDSTITASELLNWLQGRPSLPPVPKGNFPTTGWTYPEE